MKPSDLEAARLVASRFLAYAPRSRAEIERRLERGGYDDATAALIMQELTAAGLLDDARFSREWVADRADRKRYGRTRLEAELRRKGVEGDAYEPALETIDPESELRRARAALDIRLGRRNAPTGKPHGSALESNAPLESTADRLVDEASITSEKRKLAGFLQRRGFNWDTIAKVLAERAQNRE